MDNANNYIVRVKFALKNSFELVENAEIEITNKTITFIGKKRDFKKENFIYLELKHGLAVPAFVNGHTHLPETLIRGICDDEDLHTWLYDHVWKVEPSMNSEQAKIGGLLGIAEMVKSGTVAFIDQYFYSDQIAEAVSESGVKAFLAPSIFEGNPETKTIEKAFDQNKKVFKKWNGHDNRIFIGFGPHAPYSVPETTFKEIIEESKLKGTKIHTHVSETQREVNEAKEKFKLTPVEYLNALHGLEHVIAAHCVYTNENDRKLLTHNKTTIVTNPQSNLKLGSGIAPIPDYLGKINIILGTDGSASNNNLDIMEEVRLLSLIHKGLNRNPKILKIREIIPLFTSNASQIFPNNSYTGILAENNPADLIVYDLDSLTNTPVINPISNWFFSSNMSDIVLTMANGRILYQKSNGQDVFPTLDIERIKKQSQRAIEEMMVKSNYKAQITI